MTGIADPDDRELVMRLRRDAESTARATQMLADAKSARNLAAEAADAIERLHRNIDLRDDFLGSIGQWEAFVAKLPQ